MCWIEEWVKGDPQIRRWNPALTTSWVKVLDADPMRFATTVFNPTSSILTYNFGEATPSNTAFNMPTSSSWLFLNLSDLGEIIRLPMWAIMASGTASPTFLTLSYNPTRKVTYDRWVAKQLSKLDS